MALIRYFNKSDEIKQKFNTQCDFVKKRYVLDISCIGLRNLMRNISIPKIEFQVYDQTTPINMSKDSEIESNIQSKNLNICKTGRILLNLPIYYIFWPFIKILVFDLELSQHPLY